MTAPGDTVLAPSPPEPDGANVVFGNRSSGVGQVLGYTGVELAPSGSFPASEPDTLQTLRNGFQTLVTSSLDSLNQLSRQLPVVGRSLGPALSGIQPEKPPVADDEESNGPEPADPSEGADSTILRRLIESGSGGFSVGEIGRSITTFAELCGPIG